MRETPKSFVNCFSGSGGWVSNRLSHPVHNSEEVFSPRQCLGRRQIFAGHFGCKPVAILVNAVVSLR